MTATLAVRTLSAESAAQLGAIAQRLGQGCFTFGGSEWRYALAPAAGLLPWPEQAFALDIEWGGAALQIVAPASLPALLHAHRFPSGALDVLPDELALAAFEATWRELLGQLERLSGRRVRLQRIRRGTPVPLPEQAFVFVLTLDSTAAADGVHVVLAADAPALALLALLARRCPLPARPAPHPQQPLRLRLTLGGLALSVAQLRQLNVHDVLLPDTAIDTLAPRLALRPDAHHQLHARLTPDGLQIESALERTYMTAPPAADNAATPGRVEDIEVRITFDLGDKILTVGELGALQPGQVLALDGSVPTRVAIRANEHLVGYGELIRLDDRTGVRVIELAVRGEVT
jgi:type III secretion protein Q